MRRLLRSLSRRPAAAVALYVVICTSSGLLPIGDTDLDLFFLPSARVAANGHPLQVYTVRRGVDYPNANGPLSLVPLSAIVAVSDRIGWRDNIHLTRAAVMAFFSVFFLLMAREAMAAVDHLRERRIAGPVRLLPYALFAASPLLWHSALLYGHVEEPLSLWLVLRAVRLLRRGQNGGAAVSLGLACLARTLALLYLIPVGVLLLRLRRLRAAGQVATLCAATVALGTLPFWIADTGDVLFSLVSFRPRLAVFGGSVWLLTVGTPYEWVPQRYDILFVTAAAALMALLVARAWNGDRLGDRATYGTLTLTALCFPLLAKTVWPYYFFDAYGLALIWWLGRPGSVRTRAFWRGIVVPLSPAGCAFLADWGVGLTTVSPAHLFESLLMTALLAACALTLLVVLVRTAGVSAVPEQVPSKQLSATGPASRRPSPPA